MLLSPAPDLQLRARAKLKLRQQQGETPRVPPTFGEWLQVARPEYDWSARHFTAMRAVLDDITAGRVRRAYMSVPIRHGKALALDTPIPTPDGFKAMGDLVVGDTVFGDDGKPCHVTWLSPVFRDRHTFRVTTDDGDCVIADEAHEWPVAVTPGNRRGKGKREVGRCISIRETRWLAERQVRTGKRPYVPNAGAIDLPHAELPIDPYVLGAWLGDGHSRGGQFTVGAADRSHLEQQLQSSGHVVSWMPSMETANGGGTCTAHELRGLLVSGGLLQNNQRGEEGEKHIPAAYLRASVAQRTALLQGLIDTDGYVAKDGQVEFCTTLPDLARQVQELVWSLGRKASLIRGRATIGGRDCGEKYRVMFYMAGAARIPRKAERCRDSVKRAGRYLSFEYAGIADTRCIEVSSPTHLFLCGRGMTPTRNTEHNTISYAVFRLERDPKTRILVCSYNQRKAEKFSRDIRKLAKARGVAMSKDRDAAGEWETEAGGGVLAVGAGAGVASVNADLILIDDPIGSRDDAESPAKREQVWDWFTNDILARCEPTTAVLKTMSRWHQDDPAGRLLDQQRARWTVVDLPAEAEADDPLGRAEGEPLWPALRNSEWLNEKREELGSYGFASLLQGRPRPREGGMFKWSWWQLVEDVPLHGEFVRYWDLAGTLPKGKRHDPDYTAGALVCRRADARLCVVDVARFRKSIAERNAELRAIAEQDLRTYRGRLTWWIETEAGIAGEERTDELVRSLQAMGLTVHTERPTGSKVIRAEPLAAKAEAGNIVLGPGAWRDAFRTEAADFPNGKHDDQVDAVVGATAKLAVPAAAWGSSTFTSGFAR